MTPSSTTPVENGLTVSPEDLVPPNTQTVINAPVTKTPRAAPPPTVAESPDGHVSVQQIVSDVDTESEHVAAPSDSGIFATLIATATFFLSLATAITVTVYTAVSPHADSVTWWTNWRHILAPCIGTVMGLTAWVVFAVVTRRFTAPDQADSQRFGELRSRLGALDARLSIVCQQPEPSRSTAELIACSEARRRRMEIEADLKTTGTRWVQGNGFIELWRQVHAAEEALLIVSPREDVVGEALYDELRLDGSTITNRKDLITKLHQAVAALSSSGSGVLQPPAVTNGSGEQPPTTGAEAEARTVIRDVRRTISDFRDEKSAALIRARNRVVSTGTVTGTLAYALLVLAILVRAPTDSVVAAIAFYLIGAAVGLFNQLRRDVGDRIAGDDLGFAKTRLLYLPLLSGISAVGGVILVAILGAFGDSILSTGQNVITDPAIVGDQTGVSVSITTVPHLHQIFSLDQHPFGLIIAAIFGLTPALLVHGLESTTDRYRSDLASTKPHKQEDEGGAS